MHHFKKPFKTMLALFCNSLSLQRNSQKVITMFWHLSSHVKRTVSHPGPATAAGGAATTGAPAAIGGPVAGWAAGIGGGGYSKRGNSKRY